MMFNFTKCVISRYPNGKWGFFGRVPIELHRMVKPASAEAIMAGRATMDELGDLVELRNMVFDTKEDAQSALDHWIA